MLKLPPTVSVAASELELPLYKEASLPRLKSPFTRMAEVP